MSSTVAPRTTAARWVAVAVLMLSTFLVVTSEMLPVGVLTPMAGGLRLSPGATGASLTVTGLVSAIAAPLVPRVLGTRDRRTVLVAAALTLAAGNALTASATGFGLLAVGRIVVGIGMGTVWGLSSAVATRLVAPRDVALAVSISVSGVAAASVLGVPLGTIVGTAFGWRAAFAALAGLAILLAVALRIAVPSLRQPLTADDAGPRRSLGRPAVFIGLTVVTLLVTAHFAAYTYVRPVLEELPKMSANAIALVLLIYGVFGLLGNFAAGVAAGRRPRRTVLLLAAGIAVAIAILAAFGTNALIAGLAIAVWGAAYGGLSVAGQLWLAAAAPDRIEHVSGLYVGVFTASIALGALGGGLLVSAGTGPLLWSSAGLATVAAAVGLRRL